MPKLDGSKSMAHIHIRGAIDALLHAHCTACMFRSDGHPTYLESIPGNLERAQESLRCALADVENQMNSMEQGDGS